MFIAGRLLLVIAALPIVAAFLKAPFEIIQWQSLGSISAKISLIDSLILVIWAALAGGGVILALGLLSRSERRPWRQISARLLLASALLPIGTEFLTARHQIMDWYFPSMAVGPASGLLSGLALLVCGIWALGNCVLALVIVLNIPNLLAWIWAGRILGY
jgi:hypothetical protein